MLLQGAQGPWSRAAAGTLSSFPPLLVMAAVEAVACMLLSSISLRQPHMQPPPHRRRAQRRSERGARSGPASSRMCLIMQPSASFRLLWSRVVTWGRLSCDLSAGWGMSPKSAIESHPSGTFVQRAMHLLSLLWMLPCGQKCLGAWKGDWCANGSGQTFTHMLGCDGLKAFMTARPCSEIWHLKYGMLPICVGGPVEFCVHKSVTEECTGYSAYSAHGDSWIPAALTENFHSRNRCSLRCRHTYSVRENVLQRHRRGTG